MSTTGCNEFRKQLDTWMEGERGPEARAHVRECAHCRSLIEDMDATIPLHIVVEDWDVPDEDTGKKFTRNVWTVTGGLSGPKSENLRRLVAND